MTPTTNPYADATTNSDAVPQQATEPDADDAQGIGTKLRGLMENKNLAATLSDDKLKDIAEQCSKGFENDLRSRSHWEKNLDEWQKLALQHKDEKTFPWVGASNVKYPLVSIASMQFNARAYPSLVPSTTDIVKCTIVGKDPDGQKLEKAKRIGMYMSYQILQQMEGWEEDMDKLLIMLPIIGTMFKKTYYNDVMKVNASELVLPKRLVVDYWAKSLKSAERISEMLEVSQRKVKERQLSEYYLKSVELGQPQMADIEPTTLDKNVPSVVDETTPFSIIEQHTYYDLDGDGYSEPYVVTFERHTRKVLRIVARFDETTIKMQDGKLVKIDPIEYYTKFSFIPNPEGGFYDIGFGLLLSPLNESVNTLINQLIDSGTLSNLQGGFLGKGLKLKMGQSAWSPGEWKSVQTSADDLRKQIVPLPSKEPSDVLFKLMGTLVTSGKELASVAEIFVGKMPGQNTPATTTMATIEQGMKVFTAVYKRVYRSLKCEFEKIFDLNYTYLDPNQYEAIVDMPINPDDFDRDNYGVCPGADPNTATQTEKLMKAQGLMELLPAFPGMFNLVTVARRILDAQEQPSTDELFAQQVQQTGQYQPPPDPKSQELQMKSNAEQQSNELKQQQLTFTSQLQQSDMQTKAAMAAQAQNHALEMKSMQAQLDGVIALHRERSKMAQSAASHQQDMQQSAETHVLTMEQKKEAIKLAQQQRNSTKAGKPTHSPKR